MKTEINKIIRRIAVFFAVFFAAGLFNISANAQIPDNVVVQARAQIFSDVGTQMLNGVGEVRTYPLNDSIQSIVQQEATRAGDIENHIGLFSCPIPTTGAYRRATGTSNDLPTFSVNCPDFAGTADRALVAGDVFTLRDAWLTGTLNYLVSVRAYTKGGTDLFVASINNLMPTSAANDPQFGSSAGTGFFITNDNVRTDTFAANLIGFEEVVCANGHLSDNQIMCRAREMEDCTDPMEPAFEPLPGGIGGTCRAYNNGECPPDSPIFNTDASATGNCRLPSDDDDNGDMECASLNSGAEPIFDATEEDRCRLPSDKNGEGDAECASLNSGAEPIFDASATGNCRLPSDKNGEGDAECMSVYGDAMPIFADGETDKCRPRADFADCPTDAPYFDDTATDPAVACILPRDHRECGIVDSTMPRFDSTLPGVVKCRALMDTDCPGDQTAEQNVCTDPVCEETEELNDGTKTCEPRTSAACNADTEVFSPATANPMDGGVCTSAAEVLESVQFNSPEYTPDSCVRARWNTSFAFSNGKQEVAEVCEIPVMRQDTPTATAAGDISPQLANNQSASGCIMRETAGFVAAANMPNCENPQLFGTGRFPVRPENFNPGDMLTLTDGALLFNGVSLRRESPQSAQNRGGGNGSGGKFIFSGIGLFWAVYSWQNGSGAFNFSPDVGYALTESGYSANAAGQLNFRDENLHIYWRAGQQNADGDFGDLRYESGGKYAADLWSATFSETIAGESANYDFSLSADLRGGIWKISPTYRMQSEWKETDFGIETETHNALNLEGVLRYNRWTINPSAGFQWENTDEFANSGKFRMNAVYRF